MGKRMLLWVAVLICLVGIMAGCGSLDAVKEAKGMLEEYYDAYSDGDTQVVVNMCHTALLDDLGGEDVVHQALNTRYDYYGDIDEYNITGTSFETSGGETQVELSVQATYDFGDTLGETFTILKSGDDLSIIAIDLE